MKNEQKNRTVLIVICVMVIMIIGGIFITIKTGLLWEIVKRAIYMDRITETGSGIVREVEPATQMIGWNREAYLSLNDLRWYDCNNLLPEEKEQLIGYLPNISFNENTVFTEDISSVLQPDILLENGKNPGLGIRELHEQGITGKGVGIAIIDQGLYTGHFEYSNQIRLYEEIHIGQEEGASMHGAALASIAVGKSCGVAPEADLYYWAFNNTVDYTKQDNSAENVDWNGYARIIDRVIEVNKMLPDENKIRVIAIAKGYSFTGEEKTDERIQNMLEAIKRAERENIFVVTTSTSMNYDFLNSEDSVIAGLGKINPADNADDISNYTLGNWQWDTAELYVNSLLVPMDDRTTADMSGDTYVFYSDGGWSWTVPYVAGIYALCVQVNPDITPEAFFEKAMETSTQIECSYEQGDASMRFHAINPQALIESITK